jgi:hypothetical protein
VCPKVLHLDSESDFWQARSSLVATEPSGTDIAMPEEVRIYTASGVPHFEWVEHGTTPPDSCFPSRNAGTLVPLAEARRTFPRLPGVSFPTILNELRLRDHSVEPPSESTTYPVFVPSTDADGNALGGIRHPLLAAPLASYVGWSLRASGYAEGDLFTIQGSMIPFPQTEKERLRGDDPRPSLELRYASRDAWVARLTDAVDRLVSDRLLLAEDGDRLTTAARESWDVYQQL